MNLFKHTIFERLIFNIYECLLSFLCFVGKGGGVLLFKVVCAPNGKTKAQSKANGKAGEECKNNHASSINKNGQQVTGRLLRGVAFSARI